MELISMQTKAVPVSGRQLLVIIVACMMAFACLTLAPISAQANFSVSVNTMVLNEDDATSSEFDVALASQPSGSVEVTVKSSNYDKVRLKSDPGPATLHFTPENWNIPKSVRVVPQQDTDNNDDSVTLTIDSSSSQSFTPVTSTVSVAILDDDDNSEILRSIQSISIKENDTNLRFLSIFLSIRPTTDVEVTITSSNYDKLRINNKPTSVTLTFTPSNWDKTEYVELTPQQDADVLDESVVLTQTYSWAGIGTKRIQTTLVNVIDDDEVPRLLLSENSKSVNENDTIPTEVDVALTSQPMGNIYVTVKSSNYDKLRIKSDPGVVNLTFTPLNWNVPKTIHIYPQQDADTADDSATLTLSPSGNDYPVLSQATISVGIVDDDTVVTDPVVENDNQNIPSVQLSSQSITVNENDASPTTFDLVLTEQPSSDINVTIESSDYDKIRLKYDPGPAYLTFTPLNWETSKSVQVIPQQDSDSSDESVILTLTVTDDSESSVISTVSVTVIDDEKIPALVLSKQSITVSENNASSTNFDLALSSRPVGNVDVTIESSDYDKIRLKPDPGVVTITFTPLNWNIKRSVRVIPQQDADTANDSITLTLSPSGNDYPVLSQATISVEIVDDDTVIANPVENTDNQINPSVQVSKQSITVNENDASPTTFDLVLTEQPSSDINVTIESSNYDKVRLKPNPGMVTVTFTSLNWNVPKIINVYPQQDADTVDDSVILTLSPSGSDYPGLSQATISVGIVDDDTVITNPVEDTDNQNSPSVQVSKQSITVNENDSDPTEIELVLSSRPAGNVDVTIESSDYDKIRLKSDPGMATITFTPSDWNTKRSVQVIPQQDSDSSDESVTLTLTVTDDSLSSESLTVSVTVIDDDEDPRLLLSKQSITVNEDDSDPTEIDLVLSSRPAGNVDVTIESSDYDKIRLNPDPGIVTITFTPSDWNTKRSVQVIPQQDSDSSDESVTLTLTVTDDSLSSESLIVSVTVIDDDEDPRLLLSKQSITLNEDDSDPTEIELVLSSRPAGNVDVTIESSDYDKIRLKSDPGMATITFTPSNWNIKRSVRVIPQSDSDTTNDSINLIFEVSWNEGQQSSQMTIPVTVMDADLSGTPPKTGSPEPEDKLSKAWLGHFGNSVGDQVLDSVISRISISPTPGTYGVIAGAEFGNYLDSTPSSDLLDSSQKKNTPVQVLPLIEVLDGAALTTTQEPDASGGVLAAWGKFSVSGFESKSKGDESIGDIQTAMFGVDYASSDWLFGLILSRNGGDGSYISRESTVPDRLRSALTTATLFGSFNANDRMTIWSATGTGTGDISKKGSSRNLQAKSKLTWRMVAMGFRNTIDDLSQERGSTTTFSGDYMGVKTSAQKAVGISATDTKNSRFRVAIDHSRSNSPSNGWANSQKVRLGLITNDGDVTEGVGTEIGGSMTWHSPNRKLMLNLDGRIVVSHGDNSYKNWNYSAELASGPTVSSSMGLSFSLRQNWQSQSPDAFNLMSTSSIWERIPDTDAGKTLTFNLAYGIPIAGGRLVGSPYLSLGSSQTAQEFAVGWQAETIGMKDPDSAFDVRINQHNPDTGISDNSIVLQFRSNW